MFVIVPEARLELAQPHDHCALNTACLPISPLGPVWTGPNRPGLTHVPCQMFKCNLQKYLLLVILSGAIRSDSGGLRSRRISGSSAYVKTSPDPSTPFFSPTSRRTLLRMTGNGKLPPLCLFSFLSIRLLRSLHKHPRVMRIDIRCNAMAQIKNMSARFTHPLRDGADFFFDHFFGGI